MSTDITITQSFDPYKFPVSPIEKYEARMAKLAKAQLEEVLLAPSPFGVVKNSKHLPTPKRIIFNPPRTIVLWQDGTKTIVKCGEGDIYSQEMGYCMAFVRKVYGSRRKFKKLLVDVGVEQKEKPVVTKADGGKRVEKPQKPKAVYAKMTYPNNGYPHDVEKVKSLNENENYEVESVSTGQSHTSVWLKGISGVFNCVNFTFYDEQGNEIDLSKCSKVNPHYKT